MPDRPPTLGYRPPEPPPERRGRLHLSAEVWFVAAFVGGVAAGFVFSLLVWRTRVFVNAGAVVVAIILLWFAVAAVGVLLDRTRPAGLGLLASLPVSAIMFVSVCTGWLR